MKKLIYSIGLLLTIGNLLEASVGYPVYKILGENTYKVERGTAFVAKYHGKTYMVTNWHVCRHFEKSSAKNEAKGFETTTKIIQRVPLSDLCVMTTDQLDGIEVGSDAKLRSSVYMAGYPQYSNTIQFRSGYTTRLADETIDYDDGECPIVFKYDQQFNKKTKKMETSCENTQKIMDTTLEGTHGNSGSPVINAQGKLVGIAHSSDEGSCEKRRTCKMHYIPVSALIEILDSLEAKNP